MTTYTFDLCVRGTDRAQLAGYARTLARPGTVSVQPIDAPTQGPDAAYRLVVRPESHDPDAATTVATIAWMLSATNRLISVRERS